MKPVIVILILILLSVAAGIGYWAGHKSIAPAADAPDSASTQSADEVKPTATVQTLPIQSAHLSREVTAYGSVIAEPSEISILSVPYESRVMRVTVKPGEAVAASAELIEVCASPDTQLQIGQAQAALDAASKDFAQTQERFNDHLVTNAELLTSQQALQQAQLKVNSFKKNHADGTQKLKVEISGVVSKMDVQLGQIVPAGGPLVEVAAANHIQVRLGVESDDASKLKPGQTVELGMVHSDTGETVQGTIQLITQRVNPDTRLVDVYVALPNDSPVLLEGFVRSRLTVAQADGLVLPRNAVLPDENDFVVYTVKDGKAVKHKVTIVLESRDQVLVKAGDLHAGDAAVVVGNYTLEDGMAVVAQEAATQPSSAPSMQAATGAEESK